MVKRNLIKAQEFFEEAFLFAEQTEDHSVKAFCLNNMGMCYFEQDELAQALDYFKQALNLREQVGHPVEIATSLNNIGSTYRLRNEWKQAIEAYLKALEIYEHLGQGFEQHIYSITSCLSECYAQLGESSNS